jgi:branched-chain amino acid transport system permease protein
MTAAGNAVEMPCRAFPFRRAPCLVLLVVLALAALPLVLPSRGIGTAIQMLVAALFALAFNILWRQTRLLSFGHSAFFGIGMFATIHLMRAVAGGVVTLPLPLLPLAGLCAGLVLGIAVGFFATARTGTYFAMITLAFAEVIHQVAPQWESAFGGEAGLSTMRMAWAGVSFGSNAEVYYLVLAWSLIATAGIFYFTCTPLGRLAFALGDNELRVRFLGYSARLAKTLVFAVSAMFAGLAGGLLAVANENVDYSVFSASASGLVVIHAFIGGAGLFLGPVIGAAVLTLFGSIASDLTRLWALYQGVVFILVVMYLPQGMLGLAVEHLAPAHWRALPAIAVPLVVGIAGALLAGAGAVFVAEFISVLVADPFALQSQGGTITAKLWGASWRVDALATWALPAVAIAGGSLIARMACRRTAHRDRAGGAAEKAAS